MGWICLTATSNDTKQWINTDHIIRINHDRDGRTQLHLTEIMEQSTLDITVAETMDEVMNAIQNAGGKLVHPA